MNNRNGKAYPSTRQSSVAKLLSAEPRLQVYAPSVGVPVSLLSCDLSASALRLWIALAKFSDHNHVCWPSNRALLCLMPPGTIERTIRRAKAELEAARLLVRVAGHDMAGRETSCTSRLFFPVSVGEGGETDRGEGGETDRDEGGETDPPGTSPIGTSRRRKNYVAEVATSAPKDLVPANGKAEVAVEVLEYLNRRACRAFRPVPATLRLISARLRDATADQCRAVIDDRIRAWRSDSKMSAFLRPETLFNATKFESYLGALNGSDPDEDD